jgi:hypothetical protein
MKLLITGATGLIGDTIIRQCKRKNFQVNYLTTDRKKIINSNDLKGFYWNPGTQEVDKTCLKDVDAIINLAGCSISKYWTKKYKEKIINSRIQSVKLLFKLLSENSHKVKKIISASAIGFYPSSFTKKYNESESQKNESFLGKVVKLWENEIENLNHLHITTCTIRIGLVLAKQGGVLKKIIKPIQFGLGSALGSGKQYQSWIHIDDLATLFLFALEQDCSGIYNAVADNPVTNSEMTKAIANKLNKPIWLPKIPALVLKLFLGEMSALVLESQNVLNDKILEEGFEFQFDTIEKALDNCLVKVSQFP